MEITVSKFVSLTLLTTNALLFQITASTLFSKNTLPVSQIKYQCFVFRQINLVIKGNGKHLV